MVHLLAKKVKKVKKVKKIQAMGFNKQNIKLLDRPDCTCMMTHAFRSDFFAVAARLRQKISCWDVFLEDINKRRQTKFFFLSKL